MDAETGSRMVPLKSNGVSSVSTLNGYDLVFSPWVTTSISQYSECSGSIPLRESYHVISHIIFVRYIIHHYYTIYDFNPDVDGSIPLNIPFIYPLINVYITMVKITIFSG